MKRNFIFVTVIAAIALLSIVNFATARDRYRPSHHGYNNHGHNSNIRLYCAPEVQEGNLAAADRTLNELVLSEEFINADKFKATISEIQNIKDSKEKISKYLELVGINPNDSKEIVGFIGAREIDSKYINALEKNLDLTNSQSEIVLDTLSTALLGNL